MDPLQTALGRSNDKKNDHTVKQNRKQNQARKVIQILTWKHFLISKEARSGYSAKR